MPQPLSSSIITERPCCESCTKKADFEIRGSSNHFEDTEVCINHLEDLFKNFSLLSFNNSYWTIKCLSP